jgi:hypothetical protein
LLSKVSPGNFVDFDNKFLTAEAGLLSNGVSVPCFAQAARASGG